MALDHRTHGAIEHDDAFAQKRLQGVKIERHDCRELNGICAGDQGTN
jgi:hypothetical protein